MAVIEVNHITKEYKLGALQGIKQSLQNGLSRLKGDTIPKRPTFKALDDIDFEVKEGEVLGIIGHNGAGKSTLLKLLAHITTPTHGSIKVKGKVAPLIEVGAGLVGDLTGRENIYLNGAILGISKSEITKKLDEIVAFSELEPFIDTPIKRYSSGMAVRLGFAIATSVDSDILIVDEVLAVGDLAFQRKCFDRMEEMIRRQGKTVLLVSHNIRQVERMCSRVLLLDHGKIIKDADPRITCDQFYKISNQLIHDQSSNKSMRVVSSGEIDDLSVEILDKAGDVIDSITEGDTLRIRIRFTLKHAISNPEFHVGTHTTDFVYLTGESTAPLNQAYDYAAGIHEIEHRIPAYPLVSGTYAIRFAVLDQRGRVLFHGENLKFFNITVKSADTALQDELRLVSVPTQWTLNGNTHHKT